MSYFVYILLSGKDGRLYVGCTNDLMKRLLRHTDGFVKSTSNRRPLTLIWKEEYTDKGKAFSRERFLKSLWGARTKKKILEEYVQKIGHQ